MKKLFYLLFAVAIAGVVALFAIQAWQSTAYIRVNGNEGTLIIGERYNASRWAEPLPLKKLHTYVGTLAPKHQVILESDQELVPGSQHFIRFLSHDRLANAPDASLRPIPGRLRPRTHTDGTPVKADDTVRLNRLLQRAMGSDDTTKTPSTSAPTSSPKQQTGAVPFLFVDANDGTFAALWSNSRFGEWLAVAITLMLAHVFFVQGCAEPWRIRRSPSERKDFVHPTLRRIDPDPPPVPPKPLPIPLKKASDNEPVSASPAAAPHPEPVLKLPRSNKDDVCNPS